METAWSSEAVGGDTWQICDPASEANHVSAVVAPLPAAYCAAVDPMAPIGLYEQFEAQQGTEVIWSFEPRGLCATALFAEQTFLVSGTVLETVTAGTCGMHCTHNEAGAALQLPMNAKVYPVMFVNKGAYTVAAEQHTVASLFNLAHKPTLGPLAVAPSPVDVPNLAAGGG